MAAAPAADVVPVVILRIVPVLREHDFVAEVEDILAIDVDLDLPLRDARAHPFRRNVKALEDRHHPLGLLQSAEIPGLELHVLGISRGVSGALRGPDGLPGGHQKPSAVLARADRDREPKPPLRGKLPLLGLAGGEGLLVVDVPPRLPTNLLAVDRAVEVGNRLRATLPGECPRPKRALCAVVSHDLKPPLHPAF